MPSILFTGSESVSPMLRTMRTEQKHLSKELESGSNIAAQYGQRQRQLERELAQAQTALIGYGKSLKDARKEFERGDLSERHMTQAIEEYTMAKKTVEEYQQAIKETKKAIRELGDEQRRQSNRDSSGIGASDVSSSSIIRRQALFEAGKMVGQMAQQGVQAYITSAYGSEAGTLFSSGVSSAISGAAIGSMILPGVGTAIGAVLGGGLGLVSGSIQNFEQRDDAFKAYVQEATEGQLEAISTSISGGSTIAAGRESDLRALTSLLGGSESRAASFQQALVEIGRTPPFSYDTAMSLSRDMLGLGLSTDETMSRIGNLSNAAAALNLSESSVSSIVSYLESAQLSGKMESRVVKSLSKMGINAYEAIAKEFNIGVDEVADRLGDLDVERGISAIYKYMGQKFAGAAEGLTNTYTGASGVLESYQNDMDNAYGEGYNEARKAGIKDQIDFLGGKSGEEMQEVNRAMGAWKASLENEKEGTERDAITAVLTGVVSDKIKDTANISRLRDLADEYAKSKKIYEAGGKNAEEAYVQMGYALAEAKVIAQNEYNASDGAQLLQKSERDLANSIRNDTSSNDAFWSAGYEKGLQYTLGMADAIWNISPEVIADPSLAMDEHWVEQQRAIAGSPEFKATLAQGSSWDPAGDDSGSHAAGLNRVPYDGYRAILHEGERVLTAAETRQADRGGGKPTINLTVNVDGTGASNPKELAATVAQEIVRELTLAQQLYAG